MGSHNGGLVVTVMISLKLVGCNGLFDGSCASFSASTECWGTQAGIFERSQPIKIQGSGMLGKNHIMNIFSYIYILGDCMRL